MKIPNFTNASGSYGNAISEQVIGMMITLL